VRRRFLVERFEDGAAVLRGQDARHLGRVLRAKPGDRYELSDGAAVWLASVNHVSADAVEFLLLERVAAADITVDVTALVSIFRFVRLEWAIEKATELGVSAIRPLAAARSEAGLLAAAPKRMARWEKIAREAANQSRRTAAPQLLPPLRPATAFGETTAEIRLILSERRDAPKMETFRPASGAKSTALAFGPEGGWTEEEFAAAQAAGFQEASLGPLILRAETAVIAALAVACCAWA
jgi:16S rRNA (uracil1498-N3)-methyltransferase